MQSQAGKVGFKFVSTRFSGLRGERCLDERLSGGGTDADEEDEDGQDAQDGKHGDGEGVDDAAERGDAADDPQDAHGLQAGGEAGRLVGDHGEGDGDGDDEGVKKIPGAADEGAVPGRQRDART